MTNTTQTSPAGGTQSAETHAGTQFTPGPWEFGQICAGGYSVHSGAIDTRESSRAEREYRTCLTVATQRDDHPIYGGGITDRQAKANARLIASAPELLAMLTRYVEQEEQAAPYSSSPMREEARVIISRATGMEGR